VPLDMLDRLCLDPGNVLRLATSLWQIRRRTLLNTALAGNELRRFAWRWICSIDWL
jgi:hypothetical protein